MNSLLKFEFRKLFRQKSLYICSALLVGFIGASLYLTHLTYSGSYLFISEPVTVISSMYEALDTPPLTLFLGIFIALFVREDIMDGTLKTIYGKGYSRTQVYFAKLVSSSAAAVFFCLVCWIGTFIISSVFFQWGSGSGAALFAQLLAQLVAVFAYAAFFLVIVLAFGKTGSAIGGTIIAPLILQIFFLLAAMLAENYEILEYWLGYVLSSLSYPGFTAKLIVTKTLIALVYAVFFTTTGLLVNRKQEV